MGSHDGFNTTASVMALRIVQDFACYEERELTPLNPHQKAQYQTLRRVVQQVLQKNQKAFDEMIRKLDIALLSGEAGRTTFNKIADEMLADGEIHWGRIVALFAFSAHVGKTLVTARRSNNIGSWQDEERIIREVSSSLSDYIDRNLTSTIKDTLGGWESLSKKYPETFDVETAVWRGLVTTFVGLGVCSLMVIAGR